MGVFRNSSVSRYGGACFERRGLVHCEINKTAVGYYPAPSHVNNAVPRVCLFVVIIICLLLIIGYIFGMMTWF